MDFTRAALRRQGTADHPVPVLLLTGPHGSGGTAALDLLQDECGGDCLSTRVDLARAQAVEDAVLAIMGGLTERVRGIRPIS